MILGRETLEEHSQLSKKANKCRVGAVASFSYVWRHRHVRVIPNRESTDSLIHTRCIRESVDSLCRDGADMPRPPYIHSLHTP